jgi:hypothetical protein
VLEAGKPALLEIITREEGKVFSRGF